MRKTELNRYNRKRGKKRKEERYGLQAMVCRGLPCLVCEPQFWQGPWKFILEKLVTLIRRGHEPTRHSDPAHIPGLKMGGVGASASDIVPLCRKHHREHDSGAAGKPAFEAKYGVRLKMWAARIAQQIAIAKGER